MKVAVPLFGTRVAPRFGFADQLLLAEISDGRVDRTTVIALVAAGWHDRLTGLRDLGVELILCGGFNRRFEPLAQNLGISIIAGLAGDASDLVEVYARGEELPVARSCRRGAPGWFGPGRRGQGRGRGGKKGRIENY
jgi:predicted Fe-Mo cluster-binding NifX family protein